MGLPPEPRECQARETAVEGRCLRFQLGTLYYVLVHPQPSAHTCPCIRTGKEAICFFRYGAYLSLSKSPFKVQFEARLMVMFKNHSYLPAGH